MTLTGREMPIPAVFYDGIGNSTLSDKSRGGVFHKERPDCERDLMLKCLRHAPAVTFFLVWLFR